MNYENFDCVLRVRRLERLGGKTIGHECSVCIRGRYVIPINTLHFAKGTR